MGKFKMQNHDSLISPGYIPRSERNKTYGWFCKLRTSLCPTRRATWEGHDFTNSPLWHLVAARSRASSVLTFTTWKSSDTFGA